MKNFYKLLIPFCVFVISDLNAMNLDSRAFNLSHKIAEFKFKEKSADFKDILNSIIEEKEDASVLNDVKKIKDKLDYEEENSDSTANSSNSIFGLKVREVEKILEVVTVKKTHTEAIELAIAQLKLKLIDSIKSLLKYSEDLPSNSSDCENSY